MQKSKIVCPYHTNNKLIPSIYNPQAMVCSKCKQEKKDGRDGIYDISELQPKK